jgi:ATP/maltotriose-dependent transcriptional regulator MalT
MILAGRVGEAADLADQILATGTQTTNPVIVGFARLLRADALRAWGHHDEAERSLDDAEALFSREDVAAFDWARSIVPERAELAFDRGDHEAAARLAADAERIAHLDAMPNDRIRAQARRVLARLALARGDAATARTHAELAAELAAVMETPVEEALARHVLSAAARADGDGVAATAEAATCERLLAAVGNHYQLRALGYRDATSTPAPLTPSSSGDALADTVAPTDRN